MSAQDVLNDVSRTLTRVTVVDETGRVLERRNVRVELALQDFDSTLKVFIKPVSPSVSHQGAELQENVCSPGDSVQHCSTVSSETTTRRSEDAQAVSPGSVTSEPIGPGLIDVLEELKRRNAPAGEGNARPE